MGNPCVNDGVCTENKDPSRDQDFDCECPEPFRGHMCEKWGK